MVPADKYLLYSNLVQLQGENLFNVSSSVGILRPEPNLFKSYLNSVWHPQLTLLCIEGQPNKIEEGGNIIRSSLKYLLSMRLPPNLNPEIAEKKLKEHVANFVPLCNAKLTLNILGSGTGFNSPEMDPELKRVIDENGARVFGNPVLYLGQGGSIPFIGEIKSKFP